MRLEFCVTAALAFSAVVLCGCLVERGPIVLAERGRHSAYSVVVPDGASASIRHSAEEFTNYVAKLTGVELSIVGCVEEGGKAVRLKAVGGLGRDTFRFRTAGRDFLIEGDDDRAVLYGVYDFLEYRCGCDWLTSTQEIIPSLAKIEVPKDYSLVRKPAFENREHTAADAYNHPDFAAKLKLGGYQTAVWKDIHGGPPKVQFDPWLWKCHTFTKILPPEKHFEDHPEWYAEVNGVRKGDGRVQLCLTNPEVLAKTIEVVKERIRKTYPKCRVFGVSQSDARNFCTCPKCKALDEREGSHAGTIIAFVNEVAAAVEKEFPDVLIETIAYMYSRKPPKTLKPRDNVMINIGTDTCDYSKPMRESKYRYRHPDGDVENSIVDDLRTWCAISKHVYIWDYTMNFRYKAHTFPNIYSLKPNLETFLDCGVTEVFEQGGAPSDHQAGTALKAYLIGHLLWDPRQPLEPLLDRFYRGYYGAAAPHMRQYMEELHAISRSRDEVKNPMKMWGTLNSPALPTEFFEKGAAYYAKAAEAVKDDPVRLQNVRWEMNCNDYTRIMREKNPLEVGSPRFAEFQAAAKRILEDWDRTPASANISEVVKIREEAFSRLRALAECDPKAGGKVDFDALKIPKGPLQQRK